MILPVRVRLCLIAALLLAGAGLSGCKMSVGGGQEDEGRGEGREPRSQSVPVETSAAALRPIVASYTGTATLEAPADAQVVAKTSGILLRVLVEEGDAVEAGQVLAQLDPERARLEMARAEATLRRLQNNYQRSQELFGRKLVSAEANDQLRYEFESAKAAFELAKLELSYTTITAPISGVVAQRLAKPGNLININTPLYRIVDNSRLEAVLNVPERDMATLRAGLPIGMTADALPGQTFEGVVGRVSPVVDAGSGTFRVVAVFSGQTLLRPGMFGRLSVVYDQRADALTVPRSALIEENGEYAVFLVEDGKARRVAIKPGFMSGDLVEVLEGITEGDAVITAGKVAVRDGSEVDVLPPAGASQPSATDAPEAAGA